MKDRGFTLVEVLVALVIVAIGMAAVLATLTSAADTTAYLREKSFAEWVAMNRIAELRLQIQRPTVGKNSGQAEFAGRRWRWEQEVTRLEIPGTQRIDVRVRPDDGNTRGDAWVATVSGITGDAVERPDGRVILTPRVNAPAPQEEDGPARGTQPTPTREPEPEPEPEPPPSEPRGDSS